MQDADEPEPTPEQQFGARIRKLRDEYETTQALLAQMVEDHGVKLDPSAIARLEKGERSIRLNEAVAFASSFRMTVDELLRPALPPDEQVREAEKHLQRAKWRALSALVEHESAEERLKRLRERIAEEGGNDGEHHEAP